MNTSDEYPACFGALEQVFPKGADGLRHSPESCMVCYCKTACLRNALASREGLVTRAEQTDRAYASGSIGFLERWSRRKMIDRLRKDKSSK